ncbi:serum response factor-binding protein 1-like isoform X2 [Bacillus rossius redtenbacheri]|uniref:serum response factor-binding protein 1-like isoform X2 n=1 Tax=Bacillus rossius redtenbacheri TaxID=93214 RepID=UPI002FDDE93B
MDLTMNKKILNQQIVLMRRYSKQARVHLVRRLLRRAAVFSKKNGTEEAKKKLKRKADRLIEEILVLKGFKDDDITKFALLGQGLYLKHARKTECTMSGPEIRILAKLAIYKVLVCRVKTFRELWPDWKETVPKLLSAQSVNTKSASKQTGKIKKDNVQNSNSHITGKVLANKTKSKIKKKSKSSADKTVFKDVGGSNRKDNGDKLVSGVVHNDCNSMHSSEEVLAGNTRNLNFAQRSKQKTKKDPKLRVGKVGTTGPKKRKISPEVIMGSDAVVGNTRTSTQDKNGRWQSKMKSNKPEMKAAPLDSVAQPVFSRAKNELFPTSLTPAVTKDPFFVEAKGSAPVESTVMFEPRVANCIYGDGSNRAERRKFAVRTSGANNKSFKVDRRDVFKETKKTSDFGYNNIKKARQQVAATKSGLHPSWEAKKRIQDQQKLTVPFQGKKIKFSDDD